MTEKYSIGIVLSGGGARGYAHIGAIEAMREAGIVPEIISGVSAGSIVGAFIAAGKTPLETFALLKKGSVFKYSRIQLPKDGLLKLDGIKEVISSEIGQKQIEELKLPLVIGISNLNSGGMEYWDKGNLAEVVLASSSIPILFSPVKIGNNWYCDGGLLDNLPVKPIASLCNHIISINLNPIKPTEKIKNLVQIVSRTFYMSVNAELEFAKKVSTLYIEPEGIESSDILSSANADQVFEMGYNSTRKLIAETWTGTEFIQR